MRPDLPARRTFLAAVGAVALAPAVPSFANAAGGEPVSTWIKRSAVPLRTTDPEGSLGDLEHLRASIGGARIVGLGEAAHLTSEVTQLKHRTLRYLVERLGFRSIAWEDDWSLGTLLNQYVLTGRGDLDALIREMSTAWHSEEVASVLEYLRVYNCRHRDKVQFVGVEYYSTRKVSYDAVEAYVARHAPRRLAELQSNLNPLLPDRPMGEYVWWYWNDVDDKAPYLRRSRAVHELIRTLPHRPGDREHAITLHHARQIASFYEGFSLADNDDYRDARAAENLRWWQRFTGDKVVYWAAGAHTANVPDLRVSVPAMSFPSAGSHLRRWYGDRYRSIGFTFDHGSMYAPDQPVTMPPPLENWFERPLGEVDLPQYTLDLRRRPSASARTWLHSPLTTRGVPQAGPASTMTGGTLAEWFDVLIHRQQVSPIHPLQQAAVTGG